MAVVTLTYEQEELVQNSVRKCGFKNFELDATTGTFKGDNYLGIITTIRIKEKGDGKVLYLILKSAQTNENFRKGVPIAKAFAREAYIYNTILVRLFKFQNENNLSDPFTGAAKYYDCLLEEPNESILMENLKEHGYKLWDRKLPMNDEHVTLVFSEYARFHAASLALRRNHPEEFNELTKDLNFNIFESETPNTEEYERVINTYFKAGFSGVEGNAKAIAALERLRKNMSTLFSQDNDKEDKSKQVILHGDCWCNNLLFQYEDNSTPKKVCFIDWQISKLASPVLDLSYFFSVCSSKEIIEQLPKYLNIYYKILAHNLTEFNCDPEEVFSYDTLMNHWKKYSWYGVFMAMMILKLMLSDSEEAPDMTETLDKGQNLVDAFEFTVSRSSEYKTRLSDLVEYMAEHNYI